MDAEMSGMERMSLEELSAVLRQSGIVGAGGAGFPTYAKLDKRADTIIMNCAECEPLLKLHRQLLEHNAGEIVQAFHLLAETVEAKEAIIGIKKAYKGAIAALQECIGEYPEIRLGLLEEVYPAGDEVVLIYEVTGKVVPPGGLPIGSGVAVFNVETVYNIYRAVAQAEPVQDKLVSIVGEVEHPVTVRLPLGCSLEEAVHQAGKITTENPVYFVGGPMMGFEGSGSLPVTKTTNAVLVLPEEHLLVQRKRRKSSIDLKRAAAACCQCSMCTDLCPRHLLGHPIEPHKFMRAATCKDIQDTDIFLNTMFCSSCGLCENYSCMQGLSPRSLIADYKSGLRAHGVKPPKAEAAPVAKEREFRRAPMKRLMARLDLTKYDKPAPLNGQTVECKRVKLMLGQHIGAPAIPEVSVADEVERGQMIARPADGLSVAIHASISGKVMEVTDKYIVIQA